MDSFLPKLLAVALFFAAATGASADTGSITLGWDTNPDYVAGYKLYYGTTSGVYNRQQDAHHQTVQTLSNLILGGT